MIVASLRIYEPWTHSLSGSMFQYKLNPAAIASSIKENRTRCSLPKGEPPMATNPKEKSAFGSFTFEADRLLIQVLVTKLGLGTY